MNTEFFSTAIPFENRRSKSRVKRIEPLAWIDEIPHSIMYSYLNIKPRGSMITPPSTKVTSTRPSSTSNSLGPGKYKAHSYTCSPSFEFGRIPRFTDKNDIVHTHIFKKLSDDDKEKINLRIEKNKEYATLSVSKKKQLSMQKAMKNAAREKVSKMAKENILKEVKLLKKK